MRRCLLVLVSRWTGTATALAAVAASCVAQVKVRDSSGVTIREIVPHRLAAGGLLIGARPTVDIGDENAGPDYALHRISIVLQQSDGDILIGSRSEADLRLFDKTGKFVRRIGRKGNGPGEFQVIDRVVMLPGDSLIVSDELQRRITYLSPQGVYLKSVAMVAPPGLRVPNFLTAFNGGMTVVASISSEATPPRKESYYLTQRVFVADASGQSVRDIGTYGMSEHFVQEVTRQQGGVAFWSLAFGKTMTFAVHGDRILYGDGSSFELRFMSTSGRLSEVFRIDEPPVAVTQADKDGYRQIALGSSAGQRNVSAIRMIEQMPYPKLFPSYRGFFVAADGRIWVQRYPRPTRSADLWVVLSADGTFVDEVTMPSRFQLKYAGRDYVLGIHRDEEGVEHVWRLPIESK